MGANVQHTLRNFSSSSFRNYFYDIVGSQIKERQWFLHVSTKLATQPEESIVVGQKNDVASSILDYAPEFTGYYCDQQQHPKYSDFSSMEAIVVKLGAHSDRGRKHVPVRLFHIGVQ